MDQKLAEWLGYECGDEDSAKSGWRPVDNTTLGGDGKGCIVGLVPFNILLVICPMPRVADGPERHAVIQHKLDRLKK